MPVRGGRHGSAGLRHDSIDHIQMGTSVASQKFV